MMFYKQSILSLLFSAYLHLNVVEGLWIPDCGRSEDKEKPHCVCKNPAKWNDKICKEFWHSPDIADSMKETSRIVGGELAPRDEYPWFARLVSRDGSWWGCGGMLVAKQYVLTAAHCASSFDASSLAVQVGAVCPYSNDNCGQPVQQINVLSVQRHPDYNSYTLNGDFALLKLASVANADPVPMDQGEYVDNYSNEKRNLYSVGFGDLYYGGEEVSELRHVELAFVPRSTCNSNYTGEIFDSMMCAADPGQDTCQGDSGGPLYDADNGALVGIVSWGYGCADPRYPGVYAQVSTAWDWIRSNICDDHSDPKPLFCENLPTRSPTPPTPAPTTPTCDVGEMTVEISVTTDDYPEENSWLLTSSNGISESSETFQTDNTQYVSNFCLDSAQCHSFTIFDSWGDGIFSNGFFSVTVDGSIVLSNPSSSWSSLTSDFGNCDSTSNYPTGEPSAVPSATPSDVPSAVPTSLPSAEGPTCTDSPLDFIVRKSKPLKNCKWVEANPEQRCTKPGVALMCPFTCNKCGRACSKDSGLKFKYVNQSGFVKRKTCAFVEKNVEKRCQNYGVAETCRVACNYCAL